MSDYPKTVFTRSGREVTLLGENPNREHFTVVGYVEEEKAIRFWTPEGACAEAGYHLSTFQVEYISELNDFVRSLYQSKPLGYSFWIQNEDLKQIKEKLKTVGLTLFMRINKFPNICYVELAAVPPKPPEPEFPIWQYASGLAEDFPKLVELAARLNETPEKAAIIQFIGVQGALHKTVNLGHGIKLEFKMFSPTSSKVKLRLTPVERLFG